MRVIVAIFTAPMIIVVILIMFLGGGCEILVDSTRLELYGNEEEMAAYEEGVFHIEDAKGRVQKGPDRERLARNPSERVQRYYFSGDVLIPPPNIISVGKDKNTDEVFVGMGFERSGKIQVYSYRPQEIIIRNMRLVYDQKGIVVSLQEPDKDDVINISRQYDWEEKEQDGYFWGVSKIYYEWEARIDDPCDKGLCFDLQNGELDFDKQETFRLQFEVEYETEEGEKNTKEFEYKYKYSRKRKIRSIEILLS